MTTVCVKDYRSSGSNYIMHLKNWSWFCRLTIERICFPREKPTGAAAAITSDISHVRPVLPSRVEQMITNLMTCSNSKFRHSRRKAWSFSPPCLSVFLFVELSRPIVFSTPSALDTTKERHHASVSIVRYVVTLRHVSRKDTA